MTNDELANAFAVLVKDLHARIDALPDGQAKTKAQHQVAVIHELLNRLHLQFVESGDVQPFSGGDPKGPPPVS